MRYDHPIRSPRSPPRPDAARRRERTETHAHASRSTPMSRSASPSRTPMAKWGLPSLAADLGSGRRRVITRISPSTVDRLDVTHYRPGAPDGHPLRGASFHRRKALERLTRPAGEVTQLFPTRVPVASSACEAGFPRTTTVAPSPTDCRIDLRKLLPCRKTPHGALP